MKVMGEDDVSEEGGIAVVEVHMTFFGHVMGPIMVHEFMMS